MWAYESWVHTVRCSEQLDNSLVTQVKVCKPFYLLNAAFLPLLPDHSPSFSHNAIATSCIRATPYSSSKTLSPAASSLKRPLPLNLYIQFLLNSILSINIFNQYFHFRPIWTFFHCLPAHFTPHLCLQPQWFSGLPHKGKQNLHLMLLVEFFKTQTPVPYIRNLSWEAGKVIFKEKIKTS